MQPFWLSLARNAGFLAHICYNTRGKGVPIMFESRILWLQA